MYVYRLYCTVYSNRPTENIYMNGMTKPEFLVGNVCENSVEIIPDTVISHFLI